MKHKFRKNEVGKKYGNLEVIHEAGRSENGAMLWFCKCDCGRYIITKGRNLRVGKTKSCGCYKKNRLISINIKHGDSGRVEYSAWNAIVSRCNNPQNIAYKNYGGRGIKVCKRWLKYKNFIHDVGYRPSKNHSLERRNNDKGYSKSNCYWATRKQQSRNKRNNVWIVYNGDRMIASDFANVLGINAVLVYHHLKTKTPKQIEDYYKNKCAA